VLFETDDKSILLLSPIDATTDFFQVKYLTYFFPMASSDCLDREPGESPGLHW
jgi:hypothetical protein